MKAKKFFLRWEWLLVLLIAGVYAFFSWKLPFIWLTWVSWPWVQC